jgi:phosphate starvation-inducible PhoH-like protein
MSQIDLPKNQKSGLGKAVRILKNIQGIAHIELSGADVVRHRLVRAVITAYDKENEREELLEEQRKERRSTIVNAKAE